MDRNKRTEDKAASEQAPAGPADLEQADVDRLISGDQAARQAWERKLRALKPGKIVFGSERIAKASPPPITRSEMAEIAEGRMPEAVRKRFARRAAQSAAVDVPRRKEHGAPVRTPPGSGKIE